MGNRTKCKIVKNKVAPPFKEAEFDLLFGQGVSRTGEVIDLATDLDIVKKSGAWYSYKDAKIGQGRDAAKDYLKNNPEVMKEIEDQVIAKADELTLSSKKGKKGAAVKAAAEAAAVIADDIPVYAAEENTEEETRSAAPSVDIDADDDFEEFTPIE